MERLIYSYVPLSLSLALVRCINVWKTTVSNELSHNEDLAAFIREQVTSL